MKWQPEQTIDQQLYRLIDPKQPLQDNDVFLPSMDFSVMELIWVAFWGLVFSTGVLALSYGLIDPLLLTEPAESPKRSKIINESLLLLACLFGAYKSWSAFYGKLTRRKSFKEGRYRQGMFVLKDAILLHSMSQVLLIDKPNIHRLHVVHKGRGDSPELLMILHKDGQDNVHINLKIMKLAHTATALEQSLTEWISSGAWRVN